MSDAPHYEPLRAAKARLGGRLQEDCAGPCLACRAAGVGRGERGPMLVPDKWRKVGRHWLHIGRWLHGFELVRHLDRRDRELAQLRRPADVRAAGAR